jgi:hypothetical protein
VAVLTTFDRTARAAVAATQGDADARVWLLRAATRAERNPPARTLCRRSTPASTVARPTRSQQPETQKPCSTNSTPSSPGGPSASRSSAAASAASGADRSPLNRHPRASSSSTRPTESRRSAEPGKRMRSTEAQVPEAGHPHPRHHFPARSVQALDEGTPAPRSRPARRGGFAQSSYVSSRATALLRSLSDTPAAGGEVLSRGWNASRYSSSVQSRQRT